MADAIMQSPEAAAERITRAPLVTNNRSMSWITNHVASVTEKRAPAWWWALFTLSSSLATVSVLCIAYLISTGVGVWGLNHPVGWAWDITNFVFWIGIGHAGTLISAILFLTRQKWRTSINRAAEAMTLFAVVCAGIFPLIHVGRIWMVWFLAPVPNSNAIWQNFRSPLLWDVFAVSTYFTVSILFWYTGLVPDLATLRDRAKTKLRKFCYGIAALGWRGGNRQWKHYEMAYLVLAGLSTPLVLSVHSVVSFDFATSVIPGWHTTIFPPYFVAGAIFGGFAMVLTIMLPARALFSLHDLITDDHVDKMCKIIVLTGSIVGYAYAMEFFIAWYSGNSYERFVFVHSRLAAPFFSWFSWLPGIGPKMASLGANPAPYWWAYWSMIFCNVVVPQLFWSRYFRRHALWVFIICNFVNAGMWFERFVIIVTSLHRDFLPSSWGMFHPTWVDIWTFVGTFGIFLTLFLVFIRWLPMICIFEVKAVLPEADPHHGHDAPQPETAALKGSAH
ncbi:MAG: polysulfide reductase NrfD [Chthoniobacterales bacterium]|nr:polysulfide reductase NrfD [Chthoniobacterales bacterium]